MTELVDRIARLFPYHYSVTSAGNDASLPRWMEELPFDVVEFPSGSEYNGWHVGPKWAVKSASIWKDGVLVYDGTSSPLGVITNSVDVDRQIGLEELRTHLFFSREDPDAIVYHWTMLYRPHENLWGFCVPARLYDALEEGTYHVKIETTRTAGTMKVLDFRLPGASSDTVLLNAHNCHPFQANDDLSGCIVGIETIKRLMQIPNRRLTYRLVIAPELIGTAFWLDRLGGEARTLKQAIMLKSVGNNSPLKLQESYTGTAAVDRAAHFIFGRRFGDYTSGPFRTIYGNDETVFEAPGYEIPSISLTRFPFFGYHTDIDTVDRLSEAALEETVQVTLDICRALEADIRLKRKFSGLVCLSNPMYDLYKAAPAPGIDGSVNDGKQNGWNVLMNGFPRDIDGNTGLIAIAEKYGLDLFELHDYALKWIERNLADFTE